MTDLRLTPVSYWRVAVAVVIFAVALVSNAWKKNLVSASIGGVLLIALGLWLGFWLAGVIPKRPTPEAGSERPQADKGP